MGSYLLEGRSSDAFLYSSHCHLRYSWKCKHKFESDKDRPFNIAEVLSSTFSVFERNFAPANSYRFKIYNNYDSQVTFSSHTLGPTTWLAMYFPWLDRFVILVIEGSTSFFRMQLIIILWIFVRLLDAFNIWIWHCGFSLIKWFKGL